MSQDAPRLVMPIPCNRCGSYNLQRVYELGDQSCIPIDELFCQDCKKGMKHE